MMNVRPLSILLATCIAVISACNKDELTVVSTGSTEANACGMRIVELNVDSLFSDPPPQPWQSDIEIDVCECDTLVLEPVNIPWQLTFDYWSIDQGGEDEEFEALILDTITVSSSLQLKFQRGSGQVRLRVDVHVEPCE